MTRFRVALDHCFANRLGDVAVQLALFRAHGIGSSPAVGRIERDQVRVRQFKGGKHRAEVDGRAHVHGHCHGWRPQVEVAVV